MADIKDRDAVLTTDDLIQYGIIKKKDDAWLPVLGFKPEKAAKAKGWTISLKEDYTWATNNKKDYRFKNSSGEVQNPNTKLFPPEAPPAVALKQEITPEQTANVERTKAWILNNLPLKKGDWVKWETDNFWRSESSNVEAHGEDRSVHLQGLAADLVPKPSTGLTNRDLAIYLFVEKPKGLGQVIWYASGNHIHVAITGGLDFLEGDQTKNSDGDVTSTEYKPWRPTEGEATESYKKINAYIREKGGTPAAVGTSPAPAPVADPPPSVPPDDRSKCEDVKKKYKGFVKKKGEAAQKLLDYKRDNNVPTSWGIAVRNQKHFEDIKPKSPLGLPLLKSRKEKYDQYKKLYWSFIKVEKERDEYLNNLSDELRRECWPKFSSSLRTNEISQKVRSLVKEEIRKLFDPT
jgi:hypothetical protein